MLLRLAFISSNMAVVEAHGLLGRDHPTMLAIGW
jgi:hypothetical protein